MVELFDSSQVAAIATDCNKTLQTNYPAAPGRPGTRTISVAMNTVGPMMGIGHVQHFRFERPSPAPWPI